MSIKSNNNDGILLEAGTNELEMLVFEVADQRFGVNVAKVREILPVPEITSTAGLRDEIEGLVAIRDLVVPVANLQQCLYPKYKSGTSSESDKLLLLEYNQNHVCFRVENVERIYRISWTEVLPPNLTEDTGVITATVLLNDSIIPVLDFESLSVNLGILSFAKGGNEPRKITGKDRSHFPIVFADDSAVVRELIQDRLKEAGFCNIRSFNDGEEAWNYLSDVAATTTSTELSRTIAGVITDIEMPRLDGLSLTRKIRQVPILKNLPVILFSSIASSANENKAKQVGASAQISKPDIGELAGTLAKLLGESLEVERQLATVHP